MRSLGFLFCVACGGGGSGGGLTDDGILRNGDFETLDASGLAAEWQVIATNPGGEISVVAEPHFDGERALQWRIEAGGDGREFFIIQGGIPGDALRAGATYELTGMYQLDRLGDIGFMQGVRGEGGVEPNFDNFSEQSTLPSTVNEWEPFRFQFTIPAETVLPATWEVIIDALKFTGEPLTITIDGLGLHELTR